MNKPGVIQLIDTLNVGGAERMAVTIANLLPSESYRSFLCATRRGGMLANEAVPHVTLLTLNRKRRLDVAAIGRLAKRIRREEIRILHAHGTSLFTAVLAARFAPAARIIWHDHYGKNLAERRPAAYRKMARDAHHILVVNTALEQWAQTVLSVPRERITYLPNFVSIAPAIHAPKPVLPGAEGARILCLANLRPQKDHGNLLWAMRKVVDNVPQAHLLLVGSTSDTVYAEQVQQKIKTLGLQNYVSLLGQRGDGNALMRAADIGVLSSASEGLPLALLEYGAAGLPVVVTDVGQCAEVLDGGNAGILVPSGNAEALANALIALLQSPDLRRDYGAKLQARIQAQYSPEAGMRRLQMIYAQVLQDNATR
jgi:glycosyltransferase involved in cell wall biosynthesis